MYFPIFININKIKFLIVGAGNVALAKLEAILEFGNGENITLISKDFLPLTEKLAIDNSVKVIKDLYDEKYLSDFDVVIAATDDRQVNQKVADDAKKLGKIVNAVDDPANSDFIFGANAKFGDIIVSTGSRGVSPVLSRLIKQKIQALMPKNLTQISDFLAKNKELSRAKIKDLQTRRLFLQDVIEGPIANEIDTGNEQKAQELFEKNIEEVAGAEKNNAAVYFIGAGPGDPDLITLKAIKLLSRADIVLYDRLVAEDILSYARKDAIKINVGKTRDFHLYSQEKINETIRGYAKKGKVVVRLKGGDVSIFAHLSEEIDAIKDLDVPYQIVPGITAASGASAYAGIPLTSRDSNKSVRFLTIYKNDLVDQDYWQELAKSEDSLVLYMSSHNLVQVTNNLKEAGKNPNIALAVIEQATTKFQKVYESTIGGVEKDFNGKKFISPSLVIIGDIVKGHRDYKWREENFSGTFFKKLK